MNNPFIYHPQIKCKPHLIVRIPQIVDGSGFPELSEAQEPAGPEPVLGHDHEVGEEAGGSLDQAELKGREARLW